MNKKKQELLQLIAENYWEQALDLRYRTSPDGSGIIHTVDVHTMDALLDFVEIILGTPDGKKHLNDYELGKSHYNVLWEDLK